MSKLFDRSIPKTRQSIFAWLAILAIIAAIVRIVISYHELNQVWDEPGHIATGMQFLDQGKYTYESLHPTLGRAATAILPLLDGARSHGDTVFWNEGNDILFGQGTYWKTLTLARLGILPFFILGAFLLWSWTKKLYGSEVAFFSVLFYSLVPPVLAHAGLATTDTPVAAGFLASCYALWWFLDFPQRRRGILLGIVIGLSAATKFSFLVFFPPAALLIIAYRHFIFNRVQGQDRQPDFVPDMPPAIELDTPPGIAADSPDIEPDTTYIVPDAPHDIALDTPHETEKNSSSRFLGIVASAGLVIIVALFTIWGCYRFSFGPIPISNGTLDVTYRTGASYPAPEFLGGISSILDKNSNGAAAYFMGEPRGNHSSPWFFPVALGVKTPIAMLLLIALATYLVFSKFIFKKRANESDDKRKWALALLPLLISALLLLIVMASSINIGVRHILVIYPFLAMLAGLGAEWLWSKHRLYGRLAVLALIVWMVVSSMSSDPDRLAYFNEFASKTSAHPVLLDSDLDWGQDAFRLSDTLHKRGVQMVDIAYFDPADLRRMGIPNFERLDPYARPNSEWIAISKLPLYAYSGYEWLQSATPVAVIGNSILLFHQPIDEYSKLLMPYINKAAENALASPSPENFLNLSVMEFKAGYFDKCVIAAKKAIELKPDYAAAYNNVAAGYLRLGMWDSCIVAAQQAIRIDSSQRIAKSILATALGKKNEEQTDEAALSAKISTSNSPDTLLQLSRLAAFAGRYEDCIAAARMALKLKPDLGEAYNNICAAENKLGNFEEGKKAGEEAVRLEPNNQLATGNLKNSLDGLQKK